MTDFLFTTFLLCSFCPSLFLLHPFFLCLVKNMVKINDGIKDTESQCLLNYDLNKTPKNVNLI